MDTNTEMTPAPRFALDVNLSMLFTELPLLKRPDAAAAHGFDAVELWWPFAKPVPGDREIDALLRALADAGTRLAALNFDAGDTVNGDRGLLSSPQGSDRFRRNIDVAVGIAQRAGCRMLNALYGNREDGIDTNLQDHLAIENLALAADAAKVADITILIENLNTFDNPRYPLVSAMDSLSVINSLASAGHENVRMLCDVYHLARMGEDPADVIGRHSTQIGHVQIADVPDRHEPGTGHVAFGTVFAALEQAAYGGYVGLEYQPSTTSVASLGWLADLLNEVPRAKGQR